MLPSIAAVSTRAITYAEVSARVAPDDLAGCAQPATLALPNAQCLNRTLLHSGSGATRSQHKRQRQFNFCWLARMATASTWNRNQSTCTSSSLLLLPAFSHASH